LSANIFFSGYGDENLALVPYVTYIVCEVPHLAGHGTGSLIQAVKAYRQAESVGRMMAATASGQDWARIKDRGAVNLAKVWVCLAYACGQLFMVPDPEHQWCNTPDRGTFWYQAPAGEFAPLYRFVRMNRGLFDGFETAGPLKPPSFRTNRFIRAEERDAIRNALSAGDVRPLSSGDGKVWFFPRRKGGTLVVHLLNRDYRADQDLVVPAKNLEVRIPSELAPADFSGATLYGYDLKRPVKLKARLENGSVVVTVPKLGIWGLMEIR
jgi:hypothetical protein